MAYDGKLKFDTGVDLSGFQAGIDSIGSIADKGLKLLESSFTATFDVIKSASSGVWDFMSDSVKVGENFDSSMSQVLATLGATKDTVENGVNSYELLKETAEDMGASTQFSASQSADALNYLALAGYDATQACEALPTVLNIAAAGGMDLADASDMVTDAMSALNIEATSENLTEFGDKLAKTSQKSNTSVAELGEAILTVGGTATQLAGGTTELNTALGILANNGSKGSEGGTALRNVILSLGAPTDTAMTKIKELGLEIYDAEGNMRPLNDIFVDLQKSMSNMTQEQKNVALSTIFNKTDLTDVQSLLNSCGDTWDSLADEIENSTNACENMANTMNDNLEGDVTSMKSAFEGLQISLSDSLNDGLRTIVQNATGYLADLRQAFIDGSWNGLGTSLGDTLTKALSDNGGFVESAVWKARSFVYAFTESLKKNSSSLAKSVGNLLTKGLFSSMDMYTDVYSVGLEIVTGIAESIADNSTDIATTFCESLYVISGAISTNAPVLLQAGLTILQALLDGISEDTGYIVTCAITLITSLIDCLDSNAFLMLDSAMAIVLALSNAIVENLPMLLESALQLVMNLAQYIALALPVLIECAIELLEMLGQFIVDNLPILVDCAIAVLDSIASYIFDNLQMLLDCALQIIMQLAEYLLDDTTLNQLLECATEILTSLIGFLVDNLELLVDCAVQIIEAIASYIFDNLDKLGESAVEILTALATGLVTAVYLLIDAVAKLIADMCVKFEETDWGEVGHNIINGIADGFKAGFEKVKQTFTGVWEELKQNFCDFWDIHSPSKVMENLTEYLPKGMSIGFENEIPSTIDTFNTGLDDVANSLDFDSIYSKMQGLNYSQGGVPSYSGVVQSAYSPDDTQSSGGSSESQGTVVVENYLFKNSQKLNSMVINAGVLENARSGGNSI